jgi:hypothetical protein
MLTRLGFTLGSAALLTIAAIAVPAGASGHLAARDPEPVTTPNWAGYVATGRPSDPVAFRRVAGSWLVPAVRCTAADARASAAVWVGLGGYLRPEKSTLEHLGTDSNCDASGRPVYFAWFEVDPFLAFTIPHKLGAGDAVTATVAVLPRGRVRLALNDRTHRWAFARTISLFGQQAASAEWIVSTPENCIQTSCTLARLPDFGTVRFGHIGATAASSTGPLADPDWQAIPVELVPGTTGEVDPRASSISSRNSAGAIPGPLSPDGSSFSVIAQNTRPSALQTTQRKLRQMTRIDCTARGVLGFRRHRSPLALRR